MGMFNKNTVIEKSISERSADVLGAFSKAVTDLEEINQEAQIMVEQNEQQIATLEAQNADLMSTVGNNQTVADNIKKLLGK